MWGGDGGDWRVTVSPTLYQSMFHITQMTSHLWYLCVIILTTFTDLEML